jgi:hypothetical protein
VKRLIAFLLLSVAMLMAQKPEFLEGLGQGYDGEWAHASRQLLALAEAIRHSGHIQFFQCLACDSQHFWRVIPAGNRLQRFYVQSAAFSSCSRISAIT